MTQPVLESRAVSTIAKTTNFTPVKKRKYEILTPDTPSKKLKIEATKPSVTLIYVPKTQPADVVPNQKVQKIVNIVDQMSAWERKYLFCKMIERLKPHEFAHVKETYFAKKEIKPNK